VTPELDRSRVCLVSNDKGTVIEEREDDRGRRGGGWQVEGVASKVRGDNARAGGLVHWENGAGGNTRCVRYAAASLRSPARSQGEVDSAPCDGHRTILKKNS
jgi:hypothetical protein